MGRNGLVETFDPARLRARQACNDNASRSVAIPHWNGRGMMVGFARPFLVGFGHAT
jgi:hypothetical protein